MIDDVYAVVVGFRRDQGVFGDGYVASVQVGHSKVKGLFAFGETRKQAGAALARTIYEALENSRFDTSKISAIALIETHVVPLRRSRREP